MLFRSGPLDVVHTLHALQKRHQALQAIRDFRRNQFQIDAAALLEVSELRHFHTVQHHLPTDAPRTQRRRLPVVFFQLQVMLRQINADRFRVLDITSDELPKADLVLVRDCLVHLSFDDIRKAIENLKRSGSKWLLATTFPGRSPHDIKAGQWRPIDMTCKEIGMPNPISVFAENCTEGDGAFKDKSLGLWKFN